MHECAVSDVNDYNMENSGWYACVEEGHIVKVIG